MSDNRLAEILQKLNTMHNDGAADLSNEEYAKLQCDWLNNTVGHLNEIDGYNCSTCKNKGYIYIPQKSTFSGFFETAQRECKCKPIRDTLERARRSGLGNILTDYKFDKYETPEEWQKIIKGKAEAFCEDKAAKWFYIGGQTGAGKTHLCTAIAAHFIKAGYNCRYMLWRDDVVKLKAVVNDFELYQRQIDEFKKVDVLYIDDFLKTKDGTDPTAGDMNIAFELLNYRYSAKDKITIISSEFTINKALEFDEATIGRIYQQSGDYKISIDKDLNKNYRLKG